MEIYNAIAGVMADVGVVGKSDRNDFDKYMYRGIDAVMNALHPAMVKNQVFVVPEVLEHTREERTSAKGGLLIYSVAKVKYTFFTTDGSSVTCTVIGEGMDRGDKSMNKAMSAAFKYACFQTFCIPTAEMKDSEIDSPDPEPKPMLVNEKQVGFLMHEAGRLNVSIDAICNHYKVGMPAELTQEQYAEIIDNFRRGGQR